MIKNLIFLLTFIFIAGCSQQVTPNQPTTLTSVVNPTAFLKTGGALDYMGVKVTRVLGTQKVWAPGSASQEYPGGWVTPGQYDLTLNTSRIHHRNSGILTGSVRSGDYICGNIVSRTFEDDGYPYQNSPTQNQPADLGINNWGTSKRVTLSAGDTLHVSYGKVGIPFGQRNGSDGITVYCVTDPGAGSLPFRGGLWGTNSSPTHNNGLWTLFVSRTQEALLAQTPKAYHNYNHGPTGTGFPNPIPSDFGQQSGSQTNEQGDFVSRWIYNRTVAELHGTSAPWRGGIPELTKLVEFFFSNLQYTYCWDLDHVENNHHAHGSRNYEPYHFESILHALPGAILVGKTPSNYEPLYRVMSYMAQRTDMTMAQTGDYLFDNVLISGGLSAHKDDDDFTKWLWYTLKLNGTDNPEVKSKGGGRSTACWGPAYWALKVLMMTESVYPAQQLSYGGYNYGHGFDEHGNPGGYSEFYSGIAVNGAAWLWFTGVGDFSDLSKKARRGIQYYNTNPTGTGINRLANKWWGKWCRDTWVGEPRNPTANYSSPPGQVSISFDHATNAQYYLIFRTINGGTETLVATIADTGSGTQYWNDTSPPASPAQVDYRVLPLRYISSNPYYGSQSDYATINY